MQLDVTFIERIGATKSRVFHVFTVELALSISVMAACPGSMSLTATPWPTIAMDLCDGHRHHVQLSWRNPGCFGHCWVTMVKGLRSISSKKVWNSFQSNTVLVAEREGYIKKYMLNQTRPEQMNGWIKAGFQSVTVSTEGEGCEKYGEKTSLEFIVFGHLDLFDLRGRLFLEHSIFHP